MSDPLSAAINAAAINAIELQIPKNRRRDRARGHKDRCTREPGGAAPPRTNLTSVRCLGAGLPWRLGGGAPPLINTSQQIAQHIDFVASPRYAVEAEFPRTAKLAGLQQRQQLGLSYV